MKRCNECKWLQKYTAENGSWMNVCESEEPEEIDVGMYYVTVMNADDFDAYDCLNFAKTIMANAPAESPAERYGV